MSREFYITESRCTGKSKAHKTQLECWNEIQHNDNEIHVIEHSAYDALEAKLKIAVTAINEYLETQQFLAEPDKDTSYSSKEFREALEKIGVK